MSASPNEGHQACSNHLNTKPSSYHVCSLSPHSTITTSQRTSAPSPETALSGSDGAVDQQGVGGERRALYFRRIGAILKVKRGIDPSSFPLHPARRGAVVARQAHNLEVTGSNPVAATQTGRAESEDSARPVTFISADLSAAVWPC